MKNCVKETREARATSLDALARRVGASVATLREIESGVGSASVELALALAKALETTVEALFDDAARARDAELTVDASAPLFEAANVANGFSDRTAFKRLHPPKGAQIASSYFSKTATQEGLATSPDDLVDPTESRAARCFDLFCGLGGFRLAAERAFRKMNRRVEFSLSCEPNPFARKSYEANFGVAPTPDVETLAADDVPDFDLLLASFPCQSFPQTDGTFGFERATKGSFFYHIARFLRDKRPRAFALENVRRWIALDGGRAFEIALRVLQDELGYYVDWRVMNALDCGLPQKRERVIIVGSVDPFDLEWPMKATRVKTLDDVLLPDREVPYKYFASPRIVSKRKKRHKSKYFPSVWHENQSGMISSYPYSCALRANASHNDLLVNGERRFVPIEMLRLQGFPDDYKIVLSDAQLRKQLGASATVDLVERALERFLPLAFRSAAPST